MSSTVTAVHTFVAEHGDELEFQAGEKIEIIERDDAFGDGWYRGRNSKGEEGLFPATYIVDDAPAEPVKEPTPEPVPAAEAPTAPAPTEAAVPDSAASSSAAAPDAAPPTSPTPPPAPSGIIATAAAGVGAAAVGVSTVIGATIGEIETAIDSIALDKDDESLGIGQNARARLAAQAQLTNEARAKNRVSTGVAGLVYSDESDDEDEERKKPEPAPLAALQPPLSLPSTPPLDKLVAAPTKPATAWTVDDVVDWAKSKGFDEWQKFQEHEITGDLLLELDANLLKELDIPAFGKRLRIAQAISELRRPLSIASSNQLSPVSQNSRGLSAPTAFAIPAAPRPPSTTPPASVTPPVEWQPNHSRTVSSASNSMHVIRETEKAPVISSVPPSPVTPSSAKRESGGSLGHKRGKPSIDSKERLSFFGRNRKPAPSTPGDSRNGTLRSLGSTKVHQMQPATPEQSPVGPGSSASALKQIGQPDHSGWMKKKGDRYGWKNRYFVLKGGHLYFLKSEHEDKVKGHIALSGHRVIVDENTNPGSYGFRLVGAEKTHFFSSSEQGIIRGWMKALMKATIARDYTVPVTSSCNIPTIPLAEAQALAPRPPSPATRDATQRATRRENTNTLTPHDASILTSLDKGNRVSLTPSRPERDVRRPSTTFSHRQSYDDLVEWVNTTLPPQYPKATSFPDSFVSGEVIFLLVRGVSGIEPSPAVPPSAFSRDADGMPGIDGLFAMMDMLIDAGIDTAGVSLNEVRSGNAPAISRLLESVREWAEAR